MIIRLLLGFLLFSAYFATSLAQKNPLDSIINANPEWGEWTENPDKYQVQVLVTPVHLPSMEMGPTWKWGIPAGQYFYPASTVKMPVAVLALEWLDGQSIIGLNANSFFTTGKGKEPQTARETDETTEHGFPTVANDIRNIFLVSDNNAYNRLYELLGQDYINRRLHEMGLTDSRIIHRLSVSGFDREGNAYYNPVRFHHPDGTLYQRAERYAKWTTQYRPQGEMRGQGYTTNAGELIEKPFDFSQKNYLSLASLHGMLQRIMLPEAFPPEERFNLGAKDLKFLRAAMMQLPRKSQYSAYQRKGDNYVKFWAYGDQSESTPIPDHIRYYNKVGWAYGYLTDVAFIHDTKNEIAYFISGTIHVNENQIYNDGVYEYEEIGLPFFGQLGRAVHAYFLGGLNEGKKD